MNTINLFLSLIIFVLYSAGAHSGDNELIDAIQHTQRAATANDGKNIAKYAELAKNHADAAKNDKYIEVDNNKIDKGIKSLDEAIKAGNEENIELAKEAARSALKYFSSTSID
ncbi:MAG TPA: small metal-binding protein SmbP [Nitrosomonas sp.]|nr:small metal-binding protein SmbP [Nitrosomonas sp.]